MDVDSIALDLSDSLVGYPITITIIKLGFFQMKTTTILNDIVRVQDNTLQFILDNGCVLSLDPSLVTKNKYGDWTGVQDGTKILIHRL